MRKKMSTKLLKKILFFLMLSGAVSGLTSCSDSDSSNQEVPESNVLAFDSYQILEFKAINAEKETVDVPKEELTTHFGRRVALNQPGELEFTSDSLYIYKEGGIVERYRTKWQNNELLLFNNLTDSWGYCGKKTDDGSFLLNTGFYSLKNVHPERTFFLISQDYSLHSHSELASFAAEESNTSSTVWAKIQYTFK